MNYQNITTLLPSTTETPLLPEETKFIIVPIVVIIIVMLLSVLVSEKNAIERSCIKKDYVAGLFIG